MAILEILAFADGLFLGIVLQSYAIADVGSPVAKNCVSVLGIEIF